MITTIIFDMNGVITDDEDCHELATKQAFDQVGFGMTPELYRKFCLGRTDVSAFKDLIGSFQIPNAEINTLILEKTRFYMQLVKDNLRIYPGVLELIRSLYINYDLALTTSSTFEEVNVVVDLLDLRDRFKVIVCSRDVVNGKPDPEPYLLTASKLGTDPAECLVIEDSENGVRSAKAAGMGCVAILNTEKRDKLQLADRIVERYSEITDEFIQGLGPI